MLATIPAVLLAVLPHSPGPSAADDGLAVRAGERFRVVCHFPSPAAAEQALEVAEATWPVVCGLLGSGRERPDELLEVHLYRTAEDYRRADRELTGGAFQRNLAFAHFDSRSAHVAVQPQVADEVLDAFGPPVGTLRLVAHEAAHLVRYSVAPNHRWHPGWLVDGVASWTDQRVLEQVGRSAGVEDDPWSGRDFLRARRLLEAGELPSAAGLLADRTEGLDFYDRYAVRATFLYFLHRPAWRARGDALLREALRIGGGEDYAARLRAAASQLLADPSLADPWRDVDAAWAACLRAVEPTWDEELRLLDTSREPWLQTAFPDVRAIAWRREAEADGADGDDGDAGRGVDWSIGGALEILPGAGDQLELLLGRRANGFLAVTFKASYGVNVFDYERGRTGGDDWQMLARAPTDALPVGARVPFRVRVHGGRLSVELAGEPRLELAIDPARLRGAWGLGAHQGTAGRWVGVRVEAP